MIVTRYAIRFRTAIFVLIINLILVGLISFFGLPRELTPDIEIPVIVVSIPYPGASPADVEKLILNPLETELENLSDIDKMEGSALEGAAVVVLTFTPDTNIDETLTKTRDRVSRVRPKLPTDIIEPTVKEVSFSDFPVLIVNLSGDYSLAKLKRFATKIQDDIKTVPGVLSADISGGIEGQFSIDVDPEAAANRKVGLQDVIRAVKTENINLPGGLLEAQQTSYLVRTPADLHGVRDLKKIVVKTSQGKPIRLTDIARIRRSFKKPTSYARYNGTPSVSLSITKRVGVNIIDVVDQVKKVVATHELTAPQGTTVAMLSDRSVQIRKLVDDLVNNIITGLLLVVAVIFFFMGMRNAILVSIAVPLSMLLTFGILDLMGVTLNLVTLFALILALGMLVDNAIVVIENIYRHLGELVQEDSDRGFLRRMRILAAYTGTSEVAWPVIASTATTVAAFSPLLFWPGIMGKFMSYMPLVIIITLLSSLAIALLINPVMAAVFMARPKSTDAPKVTSDRWRESFTGFLPNIYFAVLSVAIDYSKRKPWLPLLTVALAFLSTVAVVMLFGASKLGVEFFPQTTPDRATITITAPNGTHLDGSDDIVRQVEDVLKGLKNVKSYVATPGSSMGKFKKGGASSSAHISGVSLDFLDQEDRIESTLVTINTMRERFSHIAGASIKVARQKMGPPAGAPISIELTGASYDKLGAIADRGVRLLKSMYNDGVRDPKTDYVTGRPELQVRVDRQAAKEVGASTMAVAQSVRDAIHGNDSSEIRIDNDDFDIVVRFAKARRERPSDLSSIWVTARKGMQIPLSQLTEIVRTAGAGTIRHKDTRRMVKVEADIAPGANANKIRATLAKRLDAALKLPAGYNWAFGGENVEQQKAARFLGRALMIGIFAIILILVAQFNSVLKPVIIISSVILSLVGVFAGLLITQRPFGVIMTGLGVISLAGVVVNNAIVLIDYIEQLRDAGLDAHDAVLRAGLTRLRPVLLTALTTVLGLVPMAMGWSINFLTMRFTTVGSSGEFWGGMATAVIFGLMFATFLTLVVIPALYLLMDRLGKTVKRALHDDLEEVNLDKELAAMGGRSTLGPLLAAFLLGGAALLALPSPTLAQSPTNLALKQSQGPRPQLSLPALLALLDKQGPDLKAARLRADSAALIVDRAFSALQPTIQAEGAYRLNAPVVELNFYDEKAAEGQAKAQVQGHIETLKAVRGQMTSNGQSTALLDQAIAGQEAYRDGIDLPSQDPIQIVKRHALSATLSARMSLFDMRTFDGLSLARESAAMAATGTRLSRLQLQHVVARAFLGALMQREALKVMERRLQSAQVTLEAGRTRLKAGVSTPLALRSTELTVLQAKRGVEATQIAYRSAVASVGLLVGMARDFDIAGEAKILQPKGDVEAWITQAKAQRPELLLLHRQRTFAETKAKVARNRWWPRLGLYAQSQWQNSEGFGDSNTTSMLMITLTQQLWDAGRGGIDRQDALLERQRLSVQAHQQLKRVEAEVRGATLQSSSLRRDLAAAREAVRLSEQAVQDATLGLKAGTNTELDLRRFEDREVEARLGVVAKKIALLAATLSLRLAVGLGPL